METKDALERMQRALDRELGGHHGRKGEVDRRLGHGGGFLRRKIRKGFQLKLVELFEALQTLEVEPAEFFASAFDIQPRSEELLRRQEKPGPAGRALARIETAALALEMDPPADGTPPGGRPPDEADPGRWRGRLESLSRTGLTHQRNVVRKATWVRDPSALLCYLELLDGLRFNRAGDAAALAKTVAVELVGEVRCSRQERLVLTCHAIGAFASAQRVSAEFATAARAVGFGLRLAGRHGLTAARAGLLQRGAYVLRDAGFFDHALVLLDEALVLWAELGRPADFGKTMVDRAIIFGHKAEVSRADSVFKLALNYLAGNDAPQKRNRLAAAHGIAFTQLRMGNSREAERWLERAVDLVSDDEPSALAKLIRQKGEIYYERGDYLEAERAFASARRLLEVKENPIQGALVALDLAAALAAQGKALELRQLAEEMAALLVFFEGNRLAAAALMAFIRAALEGRVSEGLIAEVGKKLGRVRPLVRAHPLKSNR